MTSLAQAPAPARSLANQTLFDNLGTTTRRSCSRPGSWRPSGRSSWSPSSTTRTCTQQALDVVDEIVELCTPLVDTILTCTIRWVQLPVALVAIDQVFQKLNQTLKDAVAPFQQGPNGSRWVNVDAYSKFRGHCMTMKVLMRTTVDHRDVRRRARRPDRHQLRLFLDVVHRGRHRDQDARLPRPGGRRRPDRQEPDHQGHGDLGQRRWSEVHRRCDPEKPTTIDPGTTPLKWKLGLREASTTDYCQ